MIKNQINSAPKLTLIIFICSILTPFVLTIFFVRTINLFILLLLFFLALLTLISTTWLLVRRKFASKKLLIPISIGSVFVFFASYGFQVYVADSIYFQLREHQLRGFVSDIKKFGKINEMSDGLRYWKSVNDVPIEPNIKNVDTIGNELGGQKYFLDDVLNSKGIDKKIYEKFRQNLIETGFMSFTILEDGCISFTMDGMLDNCYGLCYSESGIPPKSNDCGEIIRWEKISDHWYAWGTT